MQQLEQSTIIDVLAEFLAQRPTDQEILDYRIPDELQARVDEFADRNNAGTINRQELDEYGEIVRMNAFMLRLKIKILKSQQQSLQQ